MFRKLAIVVITAVAAILETVADAITATLPPPAADSPRLRVVASGRLCLRLRIVSPPPRQSRPRREAISQARAGADEAVRRAAADAAVSAAETRIADTGRQAREAIDRARADAEALVRAGEADRDQEREQAAQAADQRAADARAEDARAETRR